ncbi:MAG: Fe-S cluster biogenesis protein NfuA, 4Fe-4S-binding domain [Candidatus Methanohalarchaeum thermophilum]|uniref:Fe-S cluster biogenesis protein NfuA, 4Fe-4S-binding domain n=1 Tax=Methanohalarchaeum thermophilum TaxID=1903181 RepID=A0A1Q6DUV7_METT1|nr:MAG: Fe-S cluster biogenesis protein NfuA, 4Fe-4S-binding domain [Candidatus Methanohalarchaeum thermophilum]
MDREQIKEIIDEEIAPKLRADGGDIEFVDIEDNTVKVKLKGACAGCPMSQLTLSNTVENYLKSKIPEVEAVKPVQ